MEAVILAEGLTKRFGALTAVDGLDLAVERGEVFGFLGPNGAGKTTTIRMLMGLARPSAGSVRILGMNATSEVRKVHRRVAFVPAETTVWPQMRGAEILDVLGSLHGSFDASRRAQLCERFDFDPSKRGREYSRGNRQKLAIIAAFMLDAEVFVLDEPATGLDPLMAVEFRAVVAEAANRDATVFLSSHLLAEVEALCGRVAILRSGQVVELDRIDRMRHLGAASIEATGPPAVLEPLGGMLSKLAGAARVEIGDALIRFAYDGSVPELLGKLAAFELATIEIRRPTLEELFLGYYATETDSSPRS